MIYRSFWAPDGNKKRHEEEEREVEEEEGWEHEIRELNHSKLVMDKAFKIPELAPNKTTARPLESNYFRASWVRHLLTI